jgi:hypothetical protein
MLHSIWRSLISRSRVVDELNSTASQHNTAIAYIYFDYNDAQSQQPENVVRSLLKQILFQWPLLPKELEKFYEECLTNNRSADMTTLKKQLISSVSKSDRVIILFDALDECTTANFNDVAKLTCELRNAGVKTFCTSRIRTQDVCQKLGNPSVTEIQAHSEDVLNYISTRLDNEWEYDEEGKEEIIESLILNAEGQCSSSFGLR